MILNIFDIKIVFTACRAFLILYWCFKYVVVCLRANTPCGLNWIRVQQLWASFRQRSGNIIHRQASTGNLPRIWVRRMTTTTTTTVRWKCVNIRALADSSSTIYTADWPGRTSYWALRLSLEQPAKTLPSRFAQDPGKRAGKNLLRSISSSSRMF